MHTFCDHTHWHKGFALLVYAVVATTASAYGQIEIVSIEDLQQIGHDPAFPLDGDYVLTQDIDASATATWNEGAGFDPIGTYVEEDPSQAFTGTFDGQGYTVSGLTITRSEEDYVGLFGFIEDAEISNVAVEAGSVVGDSSVGGLVGLSSQSTITGCRANGVVTGLGIAIGGLAGGVGYSSVLECSAAGSVLSTADYCRLGGFVGAAFQTSMNKCYASSTVLASGEEAVLGGFVGQFLDSASYGMTDCFAAGAVIGSGGDIGGLIGLLMFGDVRRCYAVGEVQGYGQGLCGGGLVGENGDFHTLSDSFWDIESSGKMHSDGGTRLSSAEMMRQVTFEEAGWDFEGIDGADPIWTMVDGETLPYLSGMAEPTAQYRVTVTATGHGRTFITSGSTLRRPWSRVVLTGEGDCGYVLSHWVVNGQVLTRTNPRILYVVEDTQAEAVFGATIPIASIEELQQIGRHPAYPLDGDYVLTQNIDASATATWNGGAGFDPIGTYEAGDLSVAFRGTFDGLNHVIINLHINRPDRKHVGLFGYVSGGILSRLTLAGGSVIGGRRVGGLTGCMEAGSIVTDCHGSTAVTGVGAFADVGGVVGYAQQTTFTRCHSTGSLTADGDEGSCAGGLAGQVVYGTITDCEARGAVQARKCVGGLVGDFTGYMTACAASGSVAVGDSEAQYAGGLIGGSGGRIVRCKSSGSVSIPGGSHGAVGGLVGYNAGDIIECFSTSSVTCVATGFIRTGGLVGLASNSSPVGFSCVITDCYATGSVHGGSYVGGLVGYVLRDESQGMGVRRCYAAGPVSGLTTVCGLIGGVTFPSVADSFWDVETSGVYDSAAGTWLSTADMMLQATFEAANWDFDTVWAIHEGTSYPYHREIIGPQALPPEDCGVLESCPDFESEGTVLYASLTQDYATADLDGTGIPDSWEVAALAQAMCAGGGSLHQTAVCTFQRNLALLRMKADYAALAPYENVIAALLSVGWGLQDAVSSALGLTAVYEVIAEAAKAGIPPFSAMGDLDGDGFTNLDEYTSIVNAGLGQDNYAQAVLHVLLDGTVPGWEALSGLEDGFRWCLLASLMGLGVFAARSRPRARKKD